MVNNQLASELSNCFETFYLQGYILCKILLSWEVGKTAAGKKMRVQEKEKREMGKRRKSIKNGVKWLKNVINFGYKPLKLSRVEWTKTQFMYAYTSSTFDRHMSWVSSPPASMYVKGKKLPLKRMGEWSKCTIYTPVSL